MPGRSSISSRIAAAYRPGKVSSRRCPVRSVRDRNGDVRLLINACPEEIRAKRLSGMTFRAIGFLVGLHRRLVAYAAEARGVVREGFVLNPKVNSAPISVYMLWRQIALRVDPPINRYSKARNSAAERPLDWLR